MRTSIQRALVFSICAACAPSIIAGREERLYDTDALMWATAAYASSQFSPEGWSATQATGAPNTGDCGDRTSAWASKSSDSGMEWIEVSFPERIRARGVRIVETYNPGAVIALEIPEGASWRRVWSGTDPTEACPGVFDIALNEAIETQAVRIVLDSALVSGWNEIDAVALIAAKPEPPPPPPPPVVQQPVKSEAKHNAIVAVFDVEDAASSFDAKTAEQVTEYLATRVAQLGYRVIPRSAIRDRLRSEKSESFKGCYDEACQIELGKAVAAQKLLTTKILKVGETCALTSSLFDLKSEATEKAASARTACTANDLLGGIDQLVEQLR